MTENDDHFWSEPDDQGTRYCLWCPVTLRGTNTLVPPTTTPVEPVAALTLDPVLAFLDSDAARTAVAGTDWRNVKNQDERAGVLTIMRALRTATPPEPASGAREPQG